MKNSEFPKLKKALAFILTFAMLLSAVITAAAVPATAATGVWDGTIADSYAGGKGTLDEPYLISNGSELAKMVNEGDGSYEKYFKLTNDIYLNNVSDSNWKNNNPKAWYTRPAISNKAFQGTLDGDGHTVNGIYYNGSDSLVGLLPAIKNTVTVKNIQIDNSYLESTGYGIAALVGFVQSGSTITVSKSYIHENVTLMCKNTSGDSSAGGLFAYGWGTITVLDCAVLSSQSSEKSFAGSIMGNTWGGSVSVSNSILGDKMFGKYPGVTLNIANCYTAVEDSTGKTSICLLENMKGEAAKANMPDLDWENVWDTTDSFPVFKNVNLDGVKGEIWDGKVATGYAGGSGTETDPYIIETARQLAYLIKHDVVDSAGATNGKYYKLAADIYLNDVSNPDWKSNNPNSWYEVESSKRFAGNLDGDGYTVYGLYYSGTASFGLIPWVDMWSYDVTIKNLVISDAYISTSGQFVGAVVGYVYATANRNAVFTLSNCFVNDNVYIFSSNSSAYIGGLVGCLRSNSLNTYNFIGSASLADVRHGGGDWKCYAGLVGPAGDGNYNIDNCFAFPILAIYWGGASVPANNSYSIPSQDALLTVIGDNAKTTMPDFDWENGAFAPTQNGYPRLKIVSQRMGDANGDDAADAQDIALLKKHLIGAEISYVTDFNSDKVTDIRDLIALKKTVSEFLGEDSLAPAGYSLVWNDEFKGRTIDNAKWRTNQPRMTAYDGVGNFNEGTVRSVGNGRLLMTAYKNSDTTKYNGKTYLTTNSITTENRMSFKYGYLEVRAKVPYKAGCWPSLWLRSPNAAQTDLTGKDGYNMEVDIIEPFGYTDKNGITIHETNKSDENDHCQAAVGSYKFKNAENLANEYHTYGFLWTADEMKFFIDGECFATYTKDTLARMGYKGDFDDTVNILFDNQLITTNSPVANEEKTNTIENNEGSLPAEYSVEYVRLYQKQGDVLVLETPADGQ